MATPHTTTLSSPLGPLRLFDRGNGLCGLYFPEHRRAPTFGDAVEDPTRFEHVRHGLASYLAGDATTFEVDLDLQGTDLQVQVWEQLLRVPHGEITSYGEVARRIGRPSAVRAVAAAIGRNPVSIVVPCHRVVGADGRLTGYAGGLERKRWLLHHEGITIPAPG